MVLTIFFGVLGFGIMVFVHELGHFLAAKLSGIHVEVFSLGWGKKMVGFTRRGTSYQISWFPIGGYCKMRGDDLLKEKDRPPEKGSFFAAAPLQRILVAASGPVANLLFAILVLTVIWWAGFNVHSDGNRIILASDYATEQPATIAPANTAGLQTGDRIVALDGERVEKFQDILEKVSVAAGEPIDFTVQKESGQTRTVRIVPDLDRQTGAGRIGIYAWRDPLIASVQPGGPASLAGLQPGDRILAMDGQPVRHTVDLYQILEKRPDRVRIAYERQGSRMEDTLVVNYTGEGVPDLGLSFHQEVFRSPELGLPGAFTRGLGETWKTLAFTVKGIGLLFRGINLQNAVAGPLRITYFVGTVATTGFSIGVEEGMVSFFRFLCLLSVVLFLMNLIPIPALDGGQILIFLVEILRGRRVSPKLIGRIQVFSFSMLMVLAAFITFSDILYFLGR
jgi:regulator of sigma E protease